MSEKISVDVNIGGKIVKLSGYEEPKYYQEVATYLNTKLTEISGNKGFFDPISERSLLLSLNVADDYFKIKDKFDELEESIEGKNKEIYELKRDMIKLEQELEKLRKR